VARSANVKQKPKEGLSDELKRRLREAGAVLLLPLALYLLVCLFSYNAMDPSWSHAGQSEHARNFGGMLGAYVADLLRYLFGMVAYAFPLLLLGLGIHVLRHRDEKNDQPLGALPAADRFGVFLHHRTGPVLAELPRQRHGTARCRRRDR
jgi:S-DNA-T family DNA segregation ATPase FtsK/SpoIIIE